MISNKRDIIKILNYKSIYLDDGFYHIDFLEIKILLIIIEILKYIFRLE